MQSNQDLIQKLDRLKVILTSRARGVSNSEEAGEYPELRSEIVLNVKLKPHIPTFLHSCRSTSDFWSFIQPKFPSYWERTQYIQTELQPLFSLLEGEILSPSDGTASAVLSAVNSANVQVAWDKALTRRTSDPDGAITMARTLLEAVCKHILDEEGIAYTDKDDLSALYKQTAKTLNLAPSQHTEQIFKQVLGGCQTVVEGLGAMRNSLGDAHGKGRAGFKAAPRHAQLAVNLAGTMATFLLETHQARQTN